MLKKLNLKIFNRDIIPSISFPSLFTRKSGHESDRSRPRPINSELSSSEVMHPLDHLAMVILGFFFLEIYKFSKKIT